MKTYLSQEAIILLSSVLLLVAACYYPLFQEPDLYFITVWMYFFVVPIAILLLQRNLHTCGFVWKRWPFGKRTTALGLIVLLTVLYGASLLPEYRRYYTTFTPTDNLLFYSVVVLGSYYFAEEFFFRSFLLFGLKKKFGEFSVILQTVPFVLFHIGKPPLEAVFSVFAGVVFGHIAYRSHSFLPTFLIHWLMGLVTVALIAL